MQREIVQAADAVRRRELGNARNGRGIERCGAARRIAHQAQRAGALAHQRITGRQQREREGMLQALHDHDHLHLMLLGRVESVGTLRERDWLDADVRRLLCAGERCEQTGGARGPPGRDQHASDLTRCDSRRTL